MRLFDLRGFSRFEEALEPGIVSDEVLGCILPFFLVRVLIGPLENLVAVFWRERSGLEAPGAAEDTDLAFSGKCLEGLLRGPERERVSAGLGTGAGVGSLN